MIMDKQLQKEKEFEQRGEHQVKRYNLCGWLERQLAILHCFF